MKIINKFLPVIILLTFIGCNVTVADNNSKVMRSLNNVEGIVLIGSGNVDVVNGGNEEIKIIAPKELIPYLVTEVKDGSLLIGKRKKGWKKFRSIGDRIHYEVTVKNIDHVKVSGSGNLNAEKLYGDKCKVQYLVLET